MLIRIIIILLILSSLTGCAALEAVKAVLPDSGSGVSVDAQVGDREASVGKEETVVGDVEGDVVVTKMEKEGTVEGGQIGTVSVANGLNIWEVVGLLGAVLVIGLVIPSPLGSFKWRRGE